MTSPTYQRTPLDKRPDFIKILCVAGFYCIISGALNGVAVQELGTPVGYTSGGMVNSGRFFATGNAEAPKILAMCASFYCGGLLAGIWPSGCDGDHVFEGRSSPGMILSAAMIAIGAYMKKMHNRPTFAMQIWALAQGLMNATSTSFSAVPMRATHTAGGQTDAAISLGKAFVQWRTGKEVPCLRKVYLNAVCCAGMILGGMLAGKYHKRFGTFSALVPAGALFMSATLLPKMIAPDEEPPKKK
ncbi:unnamed protein product [Symbiodinium sp. CCMP2592]|nr:unnamed protein product [Symbiodinium sp. CCMP2592]